MCRMSRSSAIPEPDRISRITDAVIDEVREWQNRPLDKSYPMIYKSWESHWDDLTEFYKYPEGIRRAIYTNTAIESLNFQLRQVTKNRLIFPTDEAILKILYLAIQNASEKWTMPIRDLGQAINQFAIEFGTERVPLL